MKPLAWSRVAPAMAIWLLALGLSGCAVTPPTAPTSSTEAGATRNHWSGRLSLQIDSNPPRRYSSGFELSGHPGQGELKLLSPFGQTLANARWDASGAQLQRGSETRDYPDMDSLTSELTGTALPLATLFDWLNGQPTAMEGWTVDLSQHTEGRVSAQRLQPLPTASLKLVLQ